MTVSVWRQGRQRQHEAWRSSGYLSWPLASTMVDALVKGDNGFRRLVAVGFCDGECWFVGFNCWWLLGLAWVTFPFFFFWVCSLWVLWSEASTDGGHRLGKGYWLGDEELMWPKGGIYELQGLVWACSRSHGVKTWKVLSYLVGLLFWWFCFQVVVYGCVVWTKKFALIPKLM